MSIDAASRIREGREAEFWLDSRKIHVFDPESGENLTRDAEAGAELTRQATEDRIEAVQQGSAEGTSANGSHTSTPRAAGDGGTRPVADGGGSHSLREGG